MTSREEFETALAVFIDPARLNDRLAHDGMYYVEYATMLAWEAWQAARATPADQEPKAHERPLWDSAYKALTSRYKDENNCDASYWGAFNAGIDEAIDAMREMLDVVSATPADHSYDALWTRHGSVGNEWWSLGEFSCHKKGDIWTLHCKGKEIERHEYLQEVMKHATQNAADHIEAQSVRDAVIEECAKVVDQFANGATEGSTQFALDICSDAVRDLKSAPPQKPEV